MKNIILLLILLSPAFAGTTQQKLPFTTIPDTPVIARQWIAGGTIAALAGGSLTMLHQYWYAQYAGSPFHFFNDDHEWMQVDKAGHVFSSYFEGMYCIDICRWTGASRKASIWGGGMTAFAYQTAVELMDGFSSEWGFSVGDMAANTLGTALLIGQELGWNEQRVQLKFSVHISHYRQDPVLQEHTDALFGTRFPERTLKDYNAQTYWLSVNPSSFSKQSSFPRWLNIAIGYGADNMYGGDDNRWTDKEGAVHDYTHVHRIRQFYLSPDIDFTRIPVRKKGLKILFRILNTIKIPAPAVEFTSRGKVKWHALYF